MSRSPGSRSARSRCLAPWRQVRFSARNLLSRPPRQKRPERGRTAGSEEVWSTPSPCPPATDSSSCACRNVSINMIDRNNSRSAARRTAARDLLEYFDRTGTAYATETTIKTQAPAWRETISRRGGFHRRAAGVDAESIGAIGYSLGGFLAVALAAQANACARWWNWPG